MKTTRRDFLKKSAVSLAGLPLIKLENNGLAGQEHIALEINVFSKQLQFLDFKAVGETAAEIGFSGVDLTVRPKGHIEPDYVKEDLPRALAAIKAGGSNCNMITTTIERADNPLDRAVLKTAAENGIKYYRCNWFKYKENESMTATLDRYANQIKLLDELNSKLGITGCYQNHSGTSVGASLWEIDRLLKLIETAHFGIQYDIRHAVVEGGLSWKNGLRLIRPYIETIVLKDFKWLKKNGDWKVVNTPIGEGMVDFDSYFKLLKEYKIHVPVSMHFEYPLGGAEHGARRLKVDKQVIFTTMKKDLNEIQRLWENA